MRDLTEEGMQIVQLIGERKSFVLSGGAGSGKTYTLSEAISASLEVEQSLRIACITYTNSAAEEIRGRIDDPRLWVSTIHDFLWENIRSYQLELKHALWQLITSDDPIHGKFNLIDSETDKPTFLASLQDGVQYKEYVRIVDGVISHDEVLTLSAKMFETHPKLSRIVKDQFPCILVDEYQDTSPLVVDLLLNSLKKATSPCVIGFFGDAMQAIYEGSVGSLRNRVLNGEIVEVKKEQNRRNPQTVIDLANRLRTDGLIQVPSVDSQAPNMINGRIRKGKVQFLHSRWLGPTEVRSTLGWGDESKELNLTHNLIATRAGFPTLMEIYDKDKVLDFVRRLKNYLGTLSPPMDTSGKSFGEVSDTLRVGKSGRELKKVCPTLGMQRYIDANPKLLHAARETPYDVISRVYITKEKLLDDAKAGPEHSARPSSQRDELIKHLFRIERCIQAYLNSDFSDFIRRTDFRISCISDKATLHSSIHALASNLDLTIGDAIYLADSSGIVRIDDRLERFRAKNLYTYDRVLDVEYREFQSLYRYLEGHTPFMTQHKTKGREYPRVLVVLDNGGWNHYNFGDLFEGVGRESVRERSAKIFYVCCTRAMDELAVFYSSPSVEVVEAARNWFGASNVHDLDA